MEQKPAAGSPEALLEAEGEWALVEDKQGLSPEQKHMNSRKQVNPTSPETSKKYTESAASANVNEDVHFRVLRLERQMTSLQGDFDKILPPLSQRASADRELNRAVEEIHASKVEKMNNRAALEPVRKIEPYPVINQAAASAKPAPAKGAGLSISGVRVGEHPGKTRLVFDTSGPIKFSADVDAAEKLVIVDLPGAQWSAPLSESFKNNPLIKSYTAQSSAEGTRVAIELKKPAQIVMKTSLPANDTYGNRVVLDLAG